MEQIYVTPDLQHNYEIRKACQKALNNTDCVTCFFRGTCNEWREYVRLMQTSRDTTFLCSYCGRERPVNEKCAVAGECGNRAVCCLDCHEGWTIPQSLPDI